MNFKTLHQFIVLAAFLAFSQACQPKDPPAPGPHFASKKIKKAFKEVMTIHDEVMPYISDMKRDKKKLVALETATTTEEQNQEVQNAISMLVHGDSLMFDWMKNFKTPGPTTKEEEALPYLNIEKAKIEVVNAEMKRAIKNAQRILSQTSEE